MDGLNLIGDVIIHFYEVYAFKASLVGILIKFKPSSPSRDNSGDNTSSNIYKSILKYFQEV